MNMLEIPPISAVYPATKPEKIKKNDYLLEQHQRKKKPALAEQETVAIQHIDEVV